MPFVNVKVAGQLTIEKKSQLAERIATALEEIADKPKRTTYIVFEEVSRENWAVGDEILSIRDQKEP